MIFAVKQKGKPMDDLISRQDAIDELDKFIQWCDKALRSPLITSVDAYATKVERASLKHYREVLELLEPAQPEPKWIPVSESLPGTDDSILITYIVNGNKRKRYVVEAWYSGDGDWISVQDEYIASDSIWEVIAWMPMPKPYEEGKNE